MLIEQINIDTNVSDLQQGFNKFTIMYNTIRCKY